VISAFTSVFANDLSLGFYLHLRRFCAVPGCIFDALLRFCTPKMMPLSRPAYP
jgi:hypothetical protein